jgi:phosphoglucomutase
MGFSTVTSITILLSLSTLSLGDAFVPRLKGLHNAFTGKNLVRNRGGGRTGDRVLFSPTVAIQEVDTQPIAGMKPGTSGLRKKVEVWQGIEPSNKNYLENFIQALIDTAISKNNDVVPHTILLAGDGRYYNLEAMDIICRLLAANGVKEIWIPAGGIMSTPAVSAVIRTRNDGVCDGAIVLTASHNPGGPGEDFGIKYNLGYGQPAGEDFTDEVRSGSRLCLIYQPNEFEQLYRV